MELDMYRSKRKDKYMHKNKDKYKIINIMKTNKIIKIMLTMLKAKIMDNNNIYTTMIMIIIKEKKKEQLLDKVKGKC
jgi:hypothetical protein